MFTSFLRNNIMWRRRLSKLARLLAFRSDQPSGAPSLSSPQPLCWLHVVLVRAACRRPPYCPPHRVVTVKAQLVECKRKSFWTARKIKNLRSPFGNTCSREGNGCITHSWPPIDLLCCTDSVLQESVLNLFFFFIVHYCQFQEDLSQEELLSSLDNRYQCSKHALKKLIKVTLAAGVEITSGLVTLCFDIWEQPLVISDLGQALSACCQKRQHASEQTDKPQRGHTV